MRRGRRTHHLAGPAKAYRTLRPGRQRLGRSPALRPARRRGAAAVPDRAFQLAVCPARPRNEDGAGLPVSNRPTRSHGPEPKDDCEPSLEATAEPFSLVYSISVERVFTAAGPIAQTGDRGQI